MLEWKKDIAFSILIIILCISGILYAQTLPTGYSGYFFAESNIYMAMWLFILGLLALALLIKSLKTKPQNILYPIWFKLGVLTILTIAVYLFLIPRLGYLISSVIFLIVLISAYNQAIPDRKKTGKALVFQFGIWLLFSIVITSCVELLFTRILGVVLPYKGLF